MKQSALWDTLPPDKIPGVFEGWKTAAEFGDPEAEFHAAQGGIAIADQTMFGRIEVTGSDRLDLLHRLSTNSLTLLAPGSNAVTVFVTDKGRVIDSVIVSVRPESLALITSPGAELFLTQWIEKYTITEDIRFRTVTDDTVMVSLIGPRINSMFFSSHGTMPPPGNSVSIPFHGAELYAVCREDSRSRITHLIADNRHAPGLAALVGSLPGARWIGQSACEGFRIDREFPAKPGELSDAFTPLECGLRNAISFTKGCYIGQEVIARLETYGKSRRRIARISSGVPISGTLPVPLLSGGADAGMITSRSEIPFAGRYPALAVVRNELARPGRTLDAGAIPVTVLEPATATGA